MNGNATDHKICVDSWCYQTHLPALEAKKMCADETPQPGENLRDTCIDIRDHRLLDVGMAVLVKIRTFEPRLTEKKGEDRKVKGKKYRLGLCRWWGGSGESDEVG